MLRKIIKINTEKCNGCGACAQACHEGAIEMVNGKATLTREDYCDGLGDCLPACPMDAISFEIREAPAYNEAAVLAAKAAKKPLPCGCPGTAARQMKPTACPTAHLPSQLSQWPVQLRLVSVNAPWFDGCDLLVAADCTAFAYGNFHQDFIRGHVTVIGCPKLDAEDYSNKLGAIFAAHDIRSITLVRMEVPCCGGLEKAVERAIAASGKAIPRRVVILSADGRILIDKEG